MGASLDAAGAARITALLQRVHDQGRDTLYEPEVYAILTELGLSTPVHLVVRAAGDIGANTLAVFGGRRIVLKAMARGLTHKQACGGVRVVHKDLDFVRFSAERMRGELAEQGLCVEGILLVEHVAYSQDLGNEILLGITESDAFGPVISFSKGGGDAEHFAANFSPPNLVLGPIDRDWAQALLESTKIQKKFASQGRHDAIGQIVAAGVAFSALACRFSHFCGPVGPFVIREFEVNPFVFDPRGGFLALDGFARFAPRRPAFPARPSGGQGLKAFFEPQGIAVIGVSTRDGTKPGNIILENLLKLGRADVYGVNPAGGRTTAAGREVELYPSVAAVPAAVDLAVIAIPAEHTPAAAAACARKGVPAAILISGGFSEVRGDRAAEDAILSAARRHGMRVLGPNCLGVIHTGGGRPGVNTFFIPEEKFSLPPAGGANVAILSQSGALGITEIYNLRHAISPKVVVSYGNQLDVDPADLIEHLDTDPAVDVIGCYIEGFAPGRGRAFFDAAARSATPIIVYKAGRTPAGRRATESHTASIAGEYAVARAAVKQAGQVVADSMLDHGDLIKTFALLADFPVRGRRVAIIANAGYEKTTAADNLGGLVLAEFDAATHRALADLLPTYVTVDPLLDLTPMADDEMFEGCVDRVLGSPAVDALFISIVPHAQVIKTTDAEIDRNAANIAARLVKTVHRHKKPTVVSVNVVSGADAVYNKFGQTFDRGGVPTFLTAQQAMVCLNEFIRYRLVRESRDYGEWLRS